ncbi:MAG: response regulator [Flavobacterium sp.]|nr:response regulator [Flavobacterium sp.]
MKSIHILLVEDNEGDILLTTEALSERKIFNKISIAKDGIEAIDYLNKQNNFSNAILPDLILLDINLPKKNGHEVLEYIKSNENFKQIPVIMLTTSCSEKDILLANKNQANFFITKPVEVDEFIETVTKIENFWISIINPI